MYLLHKCLVNNKTCVGSFSNHADTEKHIDAEVEILSPVTNQDLRPKNIIKWWSSLGRLCMNLLVITYHWENHILNHESVKVTHFKTRCSKPHTSNPQTSDSSILNLLSGLHLSTVEKFKGIVKTLFTEDHWRKFF